MHFNESIFNQEQINFLFALTKMAGRGEIPSQKEFLEMTIPVLDKIIWARDVGSVIPLFKEISSHCKIPFEATNSI